MRSNVIKFDKPVSTNEIECDSMNNSQKQNLQKLIFNKLSGILNQDINKGLAMVEQLISKDDMEIFRSELQSEIAPKYNKEYQSANYNKRLKTLRSCFEGLTADSIL